MQYETASSECRTKNVRVKRKMGVKNNEEDTIGIGIQARTQV